MTHHRLSRQASALHASLLLSLGLVGVGCGGTVITSPPDGAGAPGSAGATGSAGSTGRGGSSGTAGSTGVAGRGQFPCVDETIDPKTGLLVCSNGLVHRPNAVGCGFEEPVDGAAGAASVGDPCINNAECAGLPLGFCNFAGQLGPSCDVGCQTDDDCDSDATCLCEGAGPGVCIPSNCRIDADCGANSHCAKTTGACSYGGFECTTAEDECRSDDECKGAYGFGYCTHDGKHRVCLTGICGRPFLVEEAARFADVAPRGDWLEHSLVPSVEGLSPLERTELAAHWSRLGQMEHASIAAFARFNLQLLALGAPSDLVEACNRALVDETAHAKLCFAFASAYAGEKLGPSKLDMSHCFESVDLVSVTQLVIAEGCIGETVAALEALDDAERATDPVVKSALLRIASDERNHAELAYRFVRWAVEQCDDEQRRDLFRNAELRVVAMESTARDEQQIATRRVVRPLLAMLGLNV